MEFKGERRISAPREIVYEALNDPEILRQSLPGCETLVATSDTTYEATIALKVGPVRAKFSGDVVLQDLEPPSGFTLSGQGKGGPAGFAKGRARVRLDPAEGGTLLTYEVEADIGGKIAQLGSRLIDGTANRLSGEFFDTFSALAEARSGGGSSAVDTAPSEAAAETPQAVPAGSRSKPWIWWAVGGVIVLAAIAIASGT